MSLLVETGRRYGSVEQLSEDVLRYRKGLPVTAREDTFGYRARKFVRRNRLTLTMVVALASLILGFAGMAVVHSLLVEKERLQTERVSEFLIALFESADGAVRPDAITARDLLDRGATEVALELEEQPALRATPSAGPTTISGSTITPFPCYGRRCASGGSFATRPRRSPRAWSTWRSPCAEPGTTRRARIASGKPSRSSAGSKARHLPRSPASWTGWGRCSIPGESSRGRSKPAGRRSQ